MKLLECLLQLPVGVPHKVVSRTKDRSDLRLYPAQALHDLLKLIEIRLGGIDQERQLRHKSGQAGFQIGHGPVQTIEQDIGVIDERAGGSGDLFDPVGRMSFNNRVVGKAAATGRPGGQRHELRGKQCIGTERRLDVAR